MNRERIFGSTSPAMDDWRGKFWAEPPQGKFKIWEEGRSFKE